MLKEYLFFVVTDTNPNELLNRERAPLLYIFMILGSTQFLKAHFKPSHFKRENFSQIEFSTSKLKLKSIPITNLRPTNLIK